MIAEALLAALRLAHALAAAAWVGGALVYALAPSPTPPHTYQEGGWRTLREVLRVGIGVFVLSGAIMAAERLSSAPLPPAYLAILAIKVGLGIWMFALARRVGAQHAGPLPSRRWWQRPEPQLLALGVMVYSLAMALRLIYEDTVRQASPGPFGPSRLAELATLGLGA